MPGAAALQADSDLRTPQQGDAARLEHRRPSLSSSRPPCAQIQKPQLPAASARPAPRTWPGRPHPGKEPGVTSLPGTTREGAGGLWVSRCIAGLLPRQISK